MMAEAVQEFLSLIFFICYSIGFFSVGVNACHARLLFTPLGKIVWSKKKEGRKNINERETTTPEEKKSHTNDPEKNNKQMKAVLQTG
jgi:hypothetical protein